MPTELSLPHGAAGGIAYAHAGGSPAAWVTTMAAEAMTAAASTILTLRMAFLRVE
jgi:hypothetical protein